MTIIPRVGLPDVSISYFDELVYNDSEETFTAGLTFSMSEIKFDYKVFY